MNDDVTVVIDNLKKAKNKQTNAKVKVAEWAKEIGFQVEALDKEITLLEELNTGNKLPEPFQNSANYLSKDILNQSNNLFNDINHSQVNRIIDTVGTTISGMGGLLMSGASLSYPPNQIPEAYVQLDQITSQRNQHTNIASRLKTINPALADEYNNAWDNLHTALKDETRAPMFLIREVVTGLIHHFAPDDKVVLHHKLSQKKDITRRHRVEYISSTINPAVSQTFIEQEQALLNIYPALSKAHKHGELNTQETKGYLYQANALIKLILDSFNS